MPCGYRIPARPKQYPRKLRERAGAAGGRAPRRGCARLLTGGLGVKARSPGRPGSSRSRTSACLCRSADRTDGAHRAGRLRPWLGSPAKLRIEDSAAESHTPGDWLPFGAAVQQASARIDGHLARHRAADAGDHAAAGNGQLHLLQYISERGPQHARRRRALLMLAGVHAGRRSCLPAVARGQRWCWPSATTEVADDR
jgi:hypothetical protein